MEKRDVLIRSVMPVMCNTPLEIYCMGEVVHMYQFEYYFLLERKQESK